MLAHEVRTTKYELQKLVESGVFAWEGAAQKRIVTISAEIKKLLTKSISDLETNLCEHMAKVFEGTGYSFDPEAETSSDSDSEEQSPPKSVKPKVSPKPKASDASKGSCSDAPKACEVAPPVVELLEDGDALTTFAGSTGREGAQAEVAAVVVPNASAATTAAPVEAIASVVGPVA